MTRPTYRSLFTYSLISFCGLFSVNSQSAFAQFIPDQTTATEVKGNVIAPVGAGTVSGGNLFNSFEQFNVPQSGVVFGTGNSTVDGTKINNILNRVTGDNPSQILGTIESRTAFPNANLFLLNPNGVVFGQNAKLDIGGSFNVTTGTGLGFAGDRTFSVDKASLEFPSGNPQNIKFAVSNPAAIINQGNLTVDAGKNITFTAGSVINSGLLTAPSGNVAIASVAGGSMVDLRSPDLVLGLSVLKDAIPANWNGNITNLPKLAELLTGKATEGDRVVVKPDGTLAIVATPAADQVPVTNGTTVISGTINTSSANSNGGNIGVFGDRVALVNSQITANSGNVLIGGDFQGKGVVPNAQFTYFDNKSVVDVSALQNGNGGKAIIWGDITTQFFGTILSKGGSLSGDGGFVEVSGKENLLYRGNVDTSATNGNFGTLLLDPTNITIVSADPSDNIQLSPNVPNTGDPAFAIFFNDVSTSNFTISNTLLNSATSNIILQARNDINVNAPVNVAAPNISFTAQAGNNINVNQNIQTNRGAIALFANDGTTATSTGSIQFNNAGGIALSSNGGNITLSGANVNALSTTVNFRTFSLTGGGSVDLSATGSINLPNSTYVTGVTFGGSGSSGNVNLTANTGSITVGDVIAGTAAPNNSGNGGNVFISAAGNIIATSVDSGISESTATGNAGTIIVNSTSGGTINIGNITSGVVLGSGNGNNTTISTSGAVTLQGIGTGSIGGTGTGGNLKITGGSISANAIGAASTGGTSGTVELNAVNDITVDYILNLGASQGGNVSITSDSGTIRINSTVPTIAGINLDPCVGSSICTAATNGTAGNITISGNIFLTNSTKFLSSGLSNSFVGRGVIDLRGSNINGAQNFNLDAGRASIFLGKIGEITKLGTLTVSGGSILANNDIFSGDLTFTTDLGNIIALGSLNTSQSSSGNAGNVFIQSIFTGVNISSINSSATSGNGGNISILGSSSALFLDDVKIGDINSSTSSGSAGNLLIQNSGNITTGIINTSQLSSGNAGNVSIQSGFGNITTSDINSSAFSGSAGNVTIEADADTTIRSINTSQLSSGNAGNITIQANTGNTTVTGSIDSSAKSGDGGAIVLTSFNGTVLTSDINTTAVNGRGGNVTVEVFGNLSTSNISTSNLILLQGTNSSDLNAGDVSLTSRNGNITVGTINASTSGQGTTRSSEIIGLVRLSGKAGNIDIQAFGDVNVGGLFADGSQNEYFFPDSNFTNNSFTYYLGSRGDIRLISTNGSLISNSSISADQLTIQVANSIDSGSISTFGDLTIQARNSINTLDISSYKTSIISSNGNISTGFLDVTGGLTIQAHDSISTLDILNRITTLFFDGTFLLGKGNVSLTSINGNVAIGSLYGPNYGELGGNVTIQARGDIKISGSNIDYAIDASSNSGNGGNISLISDTGAIDVSSGLISTATTTGTSGSLTFQAANSVLFRDIKTDGSGGIGGNVTIAATTGSITGNTILATSQGISTGSGNVSLTAAKDIAIASINTNTQNGKAGDISVKTDLTRGINGLTDIQANSVTGQGGNITLESGSTLPNAGLNILAGGAIAGSTIDLRTASLLIGGDLIIDSANSDILLGETSVQPFNFEIRNARDVTLSQRLFAEKVDITNTGILKFTDANTLIETPIFQQQNASEVQLTGEIRGTTITFNSPVVLTGNAILTASDSGITQGAIAFNSTLNGGGRDLKLSANELDFGNNVSGINALTLAPSSATVNIQLGGTTNVAGTFTLTETDLINVQSGGLGSLIIGGDFGAQISIVSPIPTFLQKTTIQADGFGNIDSTGLISQGSIIASAPIVTNGSDTISFIASQNVNIGDVTNPSKDIIVTSTNANVTTGKLNTTGISVSPSGNVTVTANNGSVLVNSVVTQSLGSNAGNVSIQSRNNIQTTGNTPIGGQDYAIATFSNAGNGGNVSLISNTGAINASSGRVNTASTSGTSGSITFQAAGDITTGSGTTPNPAVASFVSTGGTGTPNSITFTSTNGAINTSAGDIDAGGGNITFDARNNITTSGIFSRPLNSTNRTISLESKLGAIDTSAGDITTTLFTGNGGNITLVANGNITTKGVFASGDNGKISITSNTGSIDTSKDIPTSIGSNNSITLKADQNIKAANIIATGNNTTISITSTKGIVDTTLGFIQGGITSTQTGNGGNITIQSAGDILTGTLNAPNLSTSISGNAGSVFLTSSNGKVQFTGISVRRNGNVGGGGNITVQAQGDIISTGVLSFGNVTLSNTSNSSGNITLTSNTGKIDLSSGAIGGLDSSFQTLVRYAGNITLKSASDIILGDINAASTAQAGSISLTTTGIGAKITTGNISINTVSIEPGKVTLTTSGDITTKDINTSSLFSNGSPITLTSQLGTVTTGNLNASGGDNGANVVVIAQTAITTGAITTQGQGSRGRGGNVILDPVGNVTFTSINATGTALSGGGNINIVSTGGNVLGTGVVTFATGDPCSGATICTNGTGTVSIQHGITSPFDLNTFVVGGADTNGTIGTILAGGGSLVSLRGIPNGAGLFTQGSISISPGGGVFIPPITPPTPPVTPTPTSTPTPTPTPTPTTSGDQLPTSSPINPIIIATSTPVIVGGKNLPTIDISEISRKEAGEYLALGNLESAFEAIERGYRSSFENYLGETLTPQIKNLEQIQEDLEKASNLSGSVSTVVYPLILGDRLELLIIPPKALGKPFREFVNAAKQSEITPIIQDFANNIRDTSSEDYLAQSQKLYDWLVRPYSDRLQTLQDQYQKSDMQPSGKQLSNAETQPKQKLPPTLVFVMDGGLRVIPVAALHDGKQFLIEKYALANLPYLRATRLETRDRNLNSILAMGLTEAMQGFSALPSVKIEVGAISSQVLKGNSYLDQEFTVNNLQDKRRQGNYAILHLATHAQFISNESQGAFIQFWNERLSIDRVPSLRFDSPLIEMLTLSACQTAVGQNLGLGGLSISSGAKSVLASLWEVSDSGTAPLMIQFYNSFPENITKAIALQRAQISLIKKTVTIQDDKIIGIPNLPAIPLSQANQAEINLEHPFFWSSFILIGNWL